MTWSIKCNPKVSLHGRKTNGPQFKKQIVSGLEQLMPAAIYTFGLVFELLDTRSHLALTGSVGHHFLLLTFRRRRPIVVILHKVVLQNYNGTCGGSKKWQQLLLIWPPLPQKQFSLKPPASHQSTVSPALNGACCLKIKHYITRYEGPH